MVGADHVAPTPVSNDVKRSTRRDRQILTQPSAQNGGKVPDELKH
jgi:hypothetical protein